MFNHTTIHFLLLILHFVSYNHTIIYSIYYKVISFYFTFLLFFNIFFCRIKIQRVVSVCVPTDNQNSTQYDIAFIARSLCIFSRECLYMSNEKMSENKRGNRQNCGYVPLLKFFIYGDFWMKVGMIRHVITSVGCEIINYFQ